MLINFIFLAMLSSASVYAAARFGKRYEQTLPLSAMGVVLFLFAFGLADALEAGAVGLLVMAIVFYILTGLRLMKERDVRGLLRNLITPGSVFFAGMWILLTLWNNGKVASSWDEFSHWVDIVKAVTYVEDFGTNPAAQSTFQSYPPAMMLFQYSLQKLCILIKPGFGFSEWRTYFAFQTFFLAVFLPFFQGTSFRQPLKILVYTFIALLAPLLFYRNIYSTVYIDPFLGVLFGGGVAMTLLRPKRDGWYTAYICMLCAILTLSKDVGLFFALALAASYGLDCLHDSLECGKKWMAVLPLASAWLPKALWDWEIRTSGARVSFSGKIDWTVLWNVITGRDSSYRGPLIRTYWEALHSKTIAMGRLPLKPSYIALALIFLGILWLLWYAYRRKQPEQGKRFGAVLGLSAGTLVAYMAGLLVIYMFKFSEYEATRLASMDRYLNIAFLGIWLVILLLAANWFNCWCRREAKLILLLALVMVVPVRPFASLVRGDYVKQSVSARAPYEELRREIDQNCDGEDKIYFISQETTGFDYWVSRFNARPNSFNGNFTWSIGEAFYDGDIWTKQMTPEQWKAQLLAEYDYVALYKVNDYFLTHFAPLFAEPDAIDVNTLYRVNRETGLLDKCE